MDGTDVTIGVHVDVGLDQRSTIGVLDAELLPEDVDLMAMSSAAMDNSVSSNCFQWLQDVIFSDVDDLSQLTFCDALRCDDGDDDWRTSNSALSLFDDPMLDDGLFRCPDIHDGVTVLRAFEAVNNPEKFDMSEGCSEPNDGDFMSPASATLCQSSTDDSERNSTSFNETPSLFAIRLSWDGAGGEATDGSTILVSEKHDDPESCSISTASTIDEAGSSCWRSLRDIGVTIASVDSDVITGREMRSVLKSTKSTLDTDTKLYSKLPDYYTLMAPAPWHEVSTSEECFDKLPSYITGLRGSAVTAFDADSPDGAVKCISSGTRNSRSPVRISDMTSTVQTDMTTEMDRCTSSRSSSRSSRSSSSCSSYSSLPSYGNNVGQSTEKRSHRPRHDERSKLRNGYERVEALNADVDEKLYIEDRRVVHVGNLKPGTSRCQIRRRFEVFGPIEKVTVHRRRHGDCYAFVTFVYKVDAFEALEHGNDDVGWPKCELSLGGRRLFCLDKYSDLDATASRRDSRNRPASTLDFDQMLNAWAKTRSVEPGR